jgi:hypothetical protein
MTAALKLPSLLDEKQDWTVDDLASLPKDLRYELIDGRLILPSPTYFHQEICYQLATMLRRSSAYRSRLIGGTSRARMSLSAASLTACAARLRSRARCSSSRSSRRARISETCRPR